MAYGFDLRAYGLEVVAEVYGFDFGAVAAGVECNVDVCEPLVLTTLVTGSTDGAFFVSTEALLLSADTFGFVGVFNSLYCCNNP